MTICQRCDELLDELTRVRAELVAAREEVSARTWERDHAILGYRRVSADLLTLQAAQSDDPTDLLAALAAHPATDGPSGVGSGTTCDRGTVGCYACDECICHGCYGHESDGCMCPQPELASGETTNDLPDL